MDLILWRHAEAEDGCPDLERRLTPRGRHQAERVGKWLRDRLGDEYRLLSSPATRAVETAAGLADDSEIIPALASATGPEELLHAAGWPQSELTTILVGHQPLLGAAAAYLLTGQPAAWSVKKGAAWWFRTRAEGGRRVTTLRAVVHPELV